MRALGAIAPERLKSLRHMRQSKYGSSTRIEGSKLTDSEVDQLLANLEIRMKRVSDEAVQNLESRLRNMADDMIRRHPCMGRTIKP